MPLLFALTCVLCITVAAAQEDPVGESVTSEAITLKPDFLSPSAILNFLGVHTIGCHGFHERQSPEGIHVVEIHYNDAANLLILSGEPTDIEHVENLIRQADVPPRQIQIEVQIVEVFTSKAKDLGIDWQRLLDTSHPTVGWLYSEDERDDYTRRVDYAGRESRDHIERKTIANRFNSSANLNLAEVLEILEESGAGTVRNAPRILTLNNRRATILDGARVTYVTRYSSYTNLFEADSMDAGLTLTVLPSLGESGYITLEITAELTSLDGSMSGSPVKRGQMLENTIIVRDGESVTLGGLTRTIEDKVVKRFPILGHVLPFLFSRETSIHEQIESYILLSPRVVDFMAED
jgi:type II secretory pathway component GspD/PulD (secretin)